MGGNVISAVFKWITELSFSHHMAECVACDSVTYYFVGVWVCVFEIV